MKQDLNAMLELRSAIMETVLNHPNADVIGTCAPVNGGPISMDLEISLNDKVININLTQTGEVNEDD